MRTVLKWTGIVLGSLVILILIVGGVLYFLGSSKVDRTYVVEAADLTIPSDSASLAHGAHLLNIHGCRDCHGSDLSGAVFIDAPPFRVTASNLTPGRGGVGSLYSSEDFDRVIRNGVRPDGRPVFVMPSAAYHRLSDDDAAALIAYLMSVEPVDNELPPTEIRTAGRLLASFAIDPEFEVRTARPPVRTAPPRAATAEYGEYLTSITCQYCHGADLNGAQPPNPDSPPAPSLAASAAWGIDQFKETLRTGVRPGGMEIDTQFMPIAITGNMTDMELEALYAYLDQLF